MHTIEHSFSKVLPKLIKERGGRILVIGGEVKDLPRQYQEHPTLLLWDDDRDKIYNREIPSNVRAILTSRWVSHATMQKVNDACKRLGILKFPMLRPREMKDLLIEFIQGTDEVVSFTVSQFANPENVTVEQRQIEETVTVNTSEQEQSMAPNTKKKGFLAEFIEENIDRSKDYSKRGSVKEEGTRLYDLSRGKIKTTLSSMLNATGIEIRKSKVKSNKIENSKKVVKPKGVASATDFKDLYALIDDAAAGLKLLSEALQKFEGNIDNIVKARMKEKLNSLLGE